MRQRTIRPSYWVDELVSCASMEARLTLVGLWCLSDDYGVARGNPAMVKASLYPYDDDIAADDVQEWLDDLERCGLIVSFESVGEKYYYLPGFADDQRIDRPSKWRHPEPPEEVVQKFGIPEWHSSSTRRALVEKAKKEKKRKESTKEKKRKERNIHLRALGPLSPSPGEGDPCPPGENGYAVPESGTPDAIPYEEIRRLYNEICVPAGLPQCRFLTDTRRTRLRTCWRQERGRTDDLSWWEAYWRHVTKSDFLCGRTNRGRQWRADFDWLTKPGNLVRVREGTYH